MSACSPTSSLPGRGLLSLATPSRSPVAEANSTRFDDLEPARFGEIDLNISAA